MSDSDIIGDLAQGALTARALEPPHGEGATGHTHETACLNCGAALVGSHCHACGQAAHVHKTIGAFFHDLAHGVFHFEGKIWRTLPLLAWRPGKLTREYIDGRRASYVSPIALFLFVVFLTFAGFHALGSGINFGSDAIGRTVTLDGDKVSIVQAERQVSAELEALTRERAAAAAAGKPVAKFDADLAERRDDLATIKALRSGNIAAIASEANVTSKSSRIDMLWSKAKKNPDLLFYKLQSNAYKFSWLLIPISVPFVWLLFPFDRRRGLYDHTVFVTYSLSFMMLALLVASAGARWGIMPLMMVPVLYAPFHLYRQVSETYGTSRAGAIVRTGALLVFATIALAIWASAIFGMGLGD